MAASRTGVVGIPSDIDVTCVLSFTSAFPTQPRWVMINTNFQPKIGLRQPNALTPYLFLFGSQRRWSLSLPVLTLIFPALLPCLVRDSLCTALQTKILWINWSLNAIDTIETWVSGNLTALTERSQPAIRWRVGEVANRVSGGSFRGGHWYLPIRNHDNRYFADWIRLCPGLSKNSENGNSCPKPHKAARMIEAVGRAVSIEHWDYSRNMDSIMEKFTALQREID